MDDLQEVSQSPPDRCVYAEERREGGLDPRQHNVLACYPWIRLYSCAQRLRLEWVMAEVG
jgi:hypothetical protein